MNRLGIEACERAHGGAAREHHGGLLDLIVVIKRDALICRAPGGAGLGEVGVVHLAGVGVHGEISVVVLAHRQIEARVLIDSLEYCVVVVVVGWPRRRTLIRSFCCVQTETTNQGKFTFSSIYSELTANGDAEVDNILPYFFHLDSTTRAYFSVQQDTDNDDNNRNSYNSNDNNNNDNNHLNDSGYANIKNIKIKN